MITWLPMNGTRTSTPSRPKITDGTLASRRTTGSQDVAHPLGRELDDEDGDEQRATKLITTAPPVIRIVLQIIGQAWNV